MRLIKLALENRLCDLAAQVIVIASARVVTHQRQKNKRRSGDSPNVSLERERKDASKGNQNARKPGFYSKVLNENKSGTAGRSRQSVLPPQCQR